MTGFVTGFVTGFCDLRSAATGRDPTLLAGVPNSCETGIRVSDWTGSSTLWRGHKNTLLGGLSGT